MLLSTTNNPFILGQKFWGSRHQKWALSSRDKISVLVNNVFTVHLYMKRVIRVFRLWIPTNGQNNCGKPSVSNPGGYTANHLCRITTRSMSLNCQPPKKPQAAHGGWSVTVIKYTETSAWVFTRWKITELSCRDICTVRKTKRYTKGFNC